jgi:hypothetical protein
MAVRLTAALEAAIIEARYLVNRDGRSIEEAAEAVGLSVQATRRAVSGQTWLNVGGPLPPGVRRLEKPRQKKLCRRCQILTDHRSGYCHLCRSNQPLLR